jgi:pimeloyl-ACP methyl ester carboxylesterase
VGRAVVLLHTLRTQLDYFRGLIDRLEPTRWEIVAVDLPGHGESAAPRVEYTAAYFTDAVEQLLAYCDLDDVILVGDSIGATIALGVAARANPRIAHVIAVNPYDYGNLGGIRRSGALANVVFTSMLWPGIGPIVARSASRGVLRQILVGGLHDPRALPAELVDELHRCGKRPGHARAFRSLNRQWRTWIAARDAYPSVRVPVTLVYGSDDWSHPDERAANTQVIPGAQAVSINNCGHFASLEKPDAIARLINEAA